MANQSTEQLVPIKDIKESVLLLKNGSLRMVLSVSSINFELRSAEEQMAILQGFQRFLNSIDFPLQIVISSREIDLTNYLKKVDQVIEQSANELLKIQAIEYARFIKELSGLSNIMEKEFYVVLPFYVYETPQSTGLLQSLKSVINPTVATKDVDDAQFANYRNQLLQRAELVYGGLSGLGLKVRPLDDEELKSLFYKIYNPSSKLK